MKHLAKATTIPTHNLYKYFSGNWTFNRTIYTDNGAILHATANGSASFEKDNADDTKLIFAEKGQLVLIQTGQTSAFYKNYIYRFADELYVYFNDGVDAGKLYQCYNYDMVNNEITPTDRHICASDNYNASYKITDRNNYRLQQTISGPKKDFIIITDFCRVS